MFELTPRNKPKFYEVREQLSRFFIWCSKKISPKGPYYNSYLADEMMKTHLDMMIYGKGSLEIRHKPFEAKWHEINSYMNPHHKLSDLTPENIVRDWEQVFIKKK